MSLEGTHRYDDIIDLPHHQSQKHRHMTNHERAAQFMPFAALRGFESRIDEQGRATRARVQLGPDGQAELNERLTEVLGQLGLHPWVTIVHFEPDGHKDGGSYTRTEGVIRRFDQARRVVVMDDGTSICLANIVDIQY